MRGLLKAAVLVGVSILIGLVIGANNLGFQWPVVSLGSSDTQKPKITQPFEFMYLDVTRVGAYLAQLENGAYVKEHLSERVTKKTNGEITVVNGINAGASSENEDFVEREVTPTAASSFVKLEEDLGKEVERGFLHRFADRAVEAQARAGADGDKQLEEGDFVHFRAALRAPSYLAPYLEVHHAATLSALFPMRDQERSKRMTAKRRRKAARKWEEEVGRNPRFLLSIHPMQWSSKKRNVTYLMPVRLRQLSEEPSLDSTGGMFTVVGKVVRVFTPQPVDHDSYVDSLTRQIWKQPLLNAPKDLICLATPACSTAIEESKMGGRAKVANEAHNHIAVDRRRMLTALKRDTEIGRSGAVILPIAIYR